MTTALSSLAVLALLVFGAGKIVLDYVRNGDFCLAALFAVPTLLLAAVVAYFTAVAIALFTRASATPLAPDTLDPYAMTTASVRTRRLRPALPTLAARPPVAGAAFALGGAATPCDVPRAARTTLHRAWRLLAVPPARPRARALRSVARRRGRGPAAVWCPVA